MKKIKYLLSFFILTFALGCSDDENSTDFINDVPAPANISALFTITQDNTGMVTIRPNGEGVASYRVLFGDVSGEEESISPGETATHAYAEGNYTVTIIAQGINGLETTYTQPLTVTFAAPQNVAVTITPETGNPYKVNVSATADFETYFEVYFGEDDAETPIMFNEGQTVSHTYASIGTYEVRVIAYSGGAAITEVVQNVTVFDPLLMPVNFESATLNYSFGNFGGAFTEVVNNPSVSGENTSSKVARLTKNAGAEVWAGMTLQLDQPIDFSTMQQISLKSFSPIAGAVIKLKLEALDPNINVEVDAVTTVANEWETLTYNFAGINNANNYQRIVVFYDFGNNGTGAQYHFDDLMLTAGVPQIVLPLTFDNSALTYAFTGFGGANSAVIDNPDPSGINTSPKVAALTKNNGSEVWAGTFIELAAPIDFSSLQKIKIKVWSPAAGIIVKLKLENLTNSSINIEVDATTTVAGGWEELTYNFTGINNANAYQRVVIFFDFGNNGTGATYYYDDIKLSN